MANYKNHLRVTSDECIVVNLPENLTINAQTNNIKRFQLAYH